MKKLMMAAITATVVIIVLAGCLMPVMEDATATSNTFTNDGYFRMETLSDESEYKLFWDHTNPYQVTVNDTDIFSLSGFADYFAITLFASNEFSFRFFSMSDNSRVQLYGGTGWGFGGASVSAGTDMTITVSGGYVTFTNTADTPFSVTKELPAENYIISKDGDYCMKDSSVTAYVLKDTSIIALCGLTESMGVQAGVYATGTVDDGLQYTLFRPSADSETAVFSNEVITATDVSGYNGLVKLEKINFSVTVSAGTLNPIYTYFIVPYEVTAEKTVHFTDSENAILGIVPVMLIIALLVAIVALVIRNREM